MAACTARSGPRLTATLLALAALGGGCSGDEPASGDRTSEPGSEADPESQAPEPPRPNVVLITLDTLRSDRTGPYGFDQNTTPFLSDLGTRAVVFERAFSTSSWTAPSTASIFTGLYPPEHGVIAGFRAHANLEENEAAEEDASEGVALPRSNAVVHERMQLVQLPASHPTLVERLAAAGYATYGAATNLNIGSELGFDRGYREFERMYLSSAEQVAAQVLSWKDELEAERPYFLYLHLNDVHRPYEGRAEFGYVEDEERSRTQDDLARYDSEIRYLDHWLGELYRELGWSTDTVLMIVSDHGEEFLDHGRTGHRYSLYGELNDVVMMLAAPGLEARRVDEVNVSLVDVLPTLVDGAGLDPLAGGEPSGRSLLPLARGEGLPDRVLFAHRIRGGAEEPLLERPPLWAVIADRWKLIRNGEEGTVELYETLADPEEREDLAEARPEVVEQLKAQLEAFEERAVLRQGDAVQIDVDDDLLRQLEELGYAGHD